MPRPITDGLAWGLRRVWKSRRAWLGFEIAFRVIDLIVFAPALAMVLRSLLQRWGRASVGNFEIVRFALSVEGLAAGFVVGGLWLAIRHLEVAGLLRLLASSGRAWWHGLALPARFLARLLFLGLQQLVALAVLAVPFLAALAGVYAMLWKGRDIYVLERMRPPVFWIGAGLAAVLVGGYAVLAARLILRWLLALPIALFESPGSSTSALRQSYQRTLGRHHVLFPALLAWFLADLALGVLVLSLAGVASDWALDRVGTSLAVAVPVTAAILILNGLVVAALSGIAAVSYAAVVLTLYRHLTGPEPLEAGLVDPPAQESPRSLPRRWLILGSLAGLAIATTFGSVRALSRLSLRENMKITAHRAGAARAPENTLAALRLAIEERADWAEIDVQRTSDDAIVVFHDLDLARVGGGTRSVRRTALEEIRRLDIGTALGFESKYAGERMPTLEEFLEAAGDSIKLNVELKPAGRDDEEPLTRLVVEEIQRSGMVDSCRICSQSYRSLQLVRRLEPRIEVGFIAAKVLGDTTLLDVDFLMVNTPLATEALITRASARGMEVHAWTVKDPNLVAPLLDRGVANLITDDPAGMRARLDEILALPPLERLLLRVRNELAD